MEENIHPALQGNSQFQNTDEVHIDMEQIRRERRRRETARARYAAKKTAAKEALTAINTPRHNKTDWQSEAKSMDTVDRAIAKTEERGIQYVRSYNPIHRGATLAGVEAVTYKDGRIVTVGKHIWNAEDGHTHIFTVDPEYRGTGVAAGLIKHTVEHNFKMNGAPLVGSNDTSEDGARAMRAMFPEQRPTARATINGAVIHHVIPQAQTVEALGLRQCGWCEGRGRELYRYDACTRCNGTGLHPE